MATPFASARHQAALSTPTGYRRWVRVVASRGGVTREVEPIAGRLTQDLRRNGFWDGTLTFAGDDLMPRRPGDLLTPFGTTIEVTLGLTLLDGSRAVVPYGTYIIASSKPRISADERLIDIGLIDVSDRVERYRFESPFTVASGTDLAQMVNLVVTNRIGINPGVSDVGTSLGAPRVFGLDPETAPWTEIQEVLRGFSQRAWYDRVGQIRIGSVNPDRTTAYPLDHLTALAPDFDVRPPNVVVVRGEPQDGSEPVQAVAIDDNPSSPTYAGTGPGTSPYGRVTRYFSSPLIETQSQADSAAASILAEHIGQGATYTLVRPYDPTIDAGDVVSVDGNALAVDAVTVDLLGETQLKVREL